MAGREANDGSIDISLWPDQINKQGPAEVLNECACRELQPVPHIHCVAECD